ncbi:hypothetical protein VQH23_02890 [Pararoseomonas sp. SCSIO 73927]|uniref:hypothetical protein n=1 Tax=Pararoseomonas sp. SCSIO 73927 TaxID=3114537 RepID=UPI0030D2CAAD
MRMAERGMPGWSWEENFDATQRVRLAGRIVAELDVRMQDVHEPRLYAAIGHPALSRHLEGALDKIARDTENLWKVVRRTGPDAYATPDPGLFARILLLLFEFGPPEVSILTFARAQSVASDGLDAAITAIAGMSESAGPGAVRMDFDSGDLFRIV